MFEFDVSVTKPALPLLAAGLGIVGLISLAVHVMEGRARRALNEVQAVTRDVRETVGMVQSMVQLPHMVALLESAAREDTTGFSWDRTYAMAGTVRDTAAAVRDTINAEALTRLAMAAASNMDRLLETYAAQQMQTQMQTQDFRPMPAGMDVPGQTVQLATSADPCPDVAHQILMITTNIRDTVVSPAFGNLARIASQPDRWVYVLVQAAIVIFIFISALMVVVF